jgi:16S rRNA (cytosine967-C5)-methyltransferase
VIPSARINATIEILEKAKHENSNIDKVLLAYFRKRRFAGSKDRSAINEQVYNVIRNRLKIDWWLKRVNTNGHPRSQVLAELAFFNQISADEVGNLFNGEKYAPNPLSEVENQAYKDLLGKQFIDDDMPDNVRLECPEWIAGRLRSVFNNDFESCLEALNKEAPFDLRLNPLNLPKRKRIQQSLAKLGIETDSTQYSPLGLRVRVRKRIDGIKYFKSGLVEVQDEGAQLASLLVGVKPGMQVADFCAGGGGKTLVMGGLMNNTGRILAMDIEQGRLDRAGVRISRAGLHNVERKLISDENDRKLKRLTKKFDRVLVDAPCTGIGTWRRDPDTREKYTESDLGNMVILQDSILSSAARLTKPGGRLVYVTCSLFSEENEGRVEALLAKRKDYKIIPILEVWNEHIKNQGGGDCPTTSAMLQLTPDKHGTDGFFVAVLERESE